MYTYDDSEPHKNKRPVGERDRESAGDHHKCLLDLNNNTNNRSN